MRRPSVLLRRSLIFVHRWLGVALSLLFLLWFVSGIVMMYWTFPAVSTQERLQRAPVLDPARIVLTPDEAFASAGLDPPQGQVRLTTFDGRPVYRVGGRGGFAVVYADTGTEQWFVDEALADRAAAAWAGLPPGEAQRTSVEDLDQWTVSGNLRSIRPLYKYEFPDGQEVYVDGNTAEVVQYTTTASRFWAYLGAIPHWLYFTPLRRHQQEWFSFVVWSSLIGTIAALIGLVVAVWMYSPRQRYKHSGRRTSVPYHGWKRWHTIAGLLFGAVTVTWAFSGLLSMGPFPIVDRLTALTVPSDPPPRAGGGTEDRPAGRGRMRRRAPNLAGALRGRGVTLASYAGKHPRDAIASVADFDVKELEFSSFDGQPVYVAHDGRGGTRIVPVDGRPAATFDPAEVMRVVREASGGNLAELRLMDQYDAYYLDRRGQRPLPVISARMNDAVSSRFYIDPKTARVVGTYSSRNWVSRWLYRGLHSFEFPWLYNYRPLWDIVVISLMLGGTALCLTSLVLTWRVLTRRVRRLIRAWTAEDRDAPRPSPADVDPGAAVSSRRGIVEES